jgi:hypothetical protein
MNNLSEISNSLRQKYANISPYLNEHSRRIWAASEAKAIGFGGRQIVHKATGLSCNTISKGLAELISPVSKPLNMRIRKAGGGRKSLMLKDLTLKSDIEAIVAPVTRGDPENPLLWCSKSLRNIAGELNKSLPRVSHETIAKSLKQSGFSLQSNRKTKEGGNHPDRDSQFNFINNKVRDFQNRKQPVISVDTKKKELMGEFKNNGREYRPKGNPEEVNVYDFIDKTTGKAAPYGIYDLSRNNGWVSVGISADTAEFAVNSIRSWWYEMGNIIYSKSTELYINADGGGSNGSRVRLWKVQLQRFANEINKVIHVSHFPPATSKWNKIEHKMFCFISKNWRGKPLVDTATIVQLIANTTTTNGLKIKAKLDENEYVKGIKISKKEFANIALEKEDFHGEWNYKILPNKSFK